APRNMPQMKRHRRQVHRPSVHFLIAQPCTPSLDVLLHLLHRVHKLPQHRIQLAMRAAQPRLRLAGSFRLFGSLLHHSPFLCRNSRTTSPTSRCSRSTASFIARTSSALTFPASLSIAAWIPGQRRSESSLTSGTASYGGK